MSIGHLSKRFFGSLSRAPLGGDDQAWVVGYLLPGEQALWGRMSNADQRHACAVARKVVDLLGDEATRPVVAAALMHDIGKIDARVNTFERVMATLAGTTGSREQIEQWSTESGWIGKAGRYLMHNEIGAKMLTEAGSDPITVAWAREHELLHTEWTLPEEIADALYKADNA
jgi:hypothetical protein